VNIARLLKLMSFVSEVCTLFIFLCLLNAVSMDEVKKLPMYLFSTVEPQTKIIVIDCCYNDRHLWGRKKHRL